jgi:hypothetical protein
LNKTDQTPKKDEEHQEHWNEPSNVEPKPNRIWSKRRHIHVENHAKINNLASIWLSLKHYDFVRKGFKLKP